MAKAPSSQDTIAAIATPAGQAGIGIIRISGPISYAIAQKLFLPRKSLKGFESHRLYLGEFRDPESGDTVDEVLLSFMKGPRSYTCEDVIEINSHSGHVLLSKILQLVLKEGARLAEPGEFTWRAYLNGRIDLTQAEAVVDLINARSERGIHLASLQLRGHLAKEVEKLREVLMDLLAYTEVAIDFPEEEHEIMLREETAALIEHDVIGSVQTLIHAHDRRRLWVDGVRTMILGRVNVGKSSLLNRLAEEQRALVTSIPGTTRDIIESTIHMEGIPMRLMDTAGFRKVRNEVEELGIQMTKKRVEEADFLLVVVDRSRPLSQEDLDILSLAGPRQVLVVFNKMDLPSRLGSRMYHEAFKGIPSVEISALTGEGLDRLRQAVVDCILTSGTDLLSSGAAPNLRHSQLLEEAMSHFTDAARNIRESAPMEIVSADLRSGLDALGDITGETTSEDVLDRIFSRFCIGK